MLCNEFVEELLHLHDVFGMDGDVRRLTLCAAEWLVDHDLGVLECEALLGSTTHENHGSSGGSHTKTNRRHVRLHVLHGVVHRERGGDLSTGRVHIERDVLLGIFLFQEEQLRDNGVGDIIVDRRTEEDDALFEEAGINVVHALAELCFFNDSRDQRILRRDMSAADAGINTLDLGMHWETREGNSGSKRFTTTILRFVSLQE